MNGLEEFFVATLDKLQIEYNVYHHEAKFTVEEKEELDRELGIRGKHCKNLLLCDRKMTNFYMYVMPFEKSFRTSVVSKELGSSRLSFAPEEKLLEKLRCRSGSLSSLLLIFDEEGEITLGLDRELLDCEELCFHPAIDTVTITFKTRDYLEKFLPSIRHTPIIVTDKTVTE